MPTPQPAQSDIGQSAQVSAPTNLLNLTSLPFKVNKGDTFTGVVDSMTGGLLTVTITKTQTGGPTAGANLANMPMADLKDLIQNPPSPPPAAAGLPTMMAGTTNSAADLA